MDRCLVALACLVLLTASADAQGDNPEAVYKAAGAGASRPAVTVAYGPSPLQVADLHLPKGKGPFPIAVLVHGGCFMASVDQRAGMAASPML